MKISNNVIFFKKLSKTKVLRYLKIMISKFCPAGHLILIFIRKLSPPPQNYLSFPRGKSFLKQIPFHSLCKVNIGFGGTVFSENDVERTKKFQGGGGNLPRMMPCI